MDYGYACGAVKSVENNLLDKSKLAKLVRTSDQEFCKLLSDMNYGSNESTLEELINGEMKKTKSFLETLIPDNDVMEIFYLKNDAQNIKVMYKVKLFKVQYRGGFVETGVLSKQGLEEYIANGKSDKIPEKYYPLLDEIARKVENVTNARVLSSKIDNCIYEFIFKELKRHREEALKVYFTTLINFTNLLTLIRCQSLKWGLDKFLEMFIDGGSIEKNHYISAYTLASESLAKHFLNKDYGEKISKGLKTYAEDMNLNDLERFLDILMLEIMKDYGITLSTVGPLVYYYLEKQAEAKNIRMIYSNRNLDVSTLLTY